MLVVFNITEVGGPFLLFKARYVRYLMAFWCMFFMRVLMLGYGILRSVSLLIKCSCTAPRTPAVIVMRGLVFHPPIVSFELVGHIWYVYV